MVSWSDLFQFPKYWPFWLRLGILGSARDKNPKPLLWKRNGRIYRCRAWFQSPIWISFRSQNIVHKGHFDCPFGSIWVFWNLRIQGPQNTSMKVEWLHLLEGKASFQGRISFRSQDSGQNGRFGCLLGSILAYCDLNEMRTPNHFYGSGMAEFMWVEHDSRVVSLCVSRILAILAAR